MTVMLLLLHHNLPNRIELTFKPAYRGDDTLLNRPQRLLMFFVGIGGLWFIPTFHRITLLPPFVGAFCVLALLWFVNELCNRQLLGSDQMIRKRLPLALQYANLQNLLYFVGLTLMFGALTETGLLRQFLSQILDITNNCYLFGLASTLLSSLFGNIPTLVASVSLFNQPDIQAFPAELSANGTFWPLLSYATAFGGSMLSTGTIAGMLLMRMEGVSFSWYFRHITPKVLVGFFAGFFTLLAINYIMS